MYMFFLVLFTVIDGKQIEPKYVHVFYNNIMGIWAVMTIYRQ